MKERDHAKVISARTGREEDWLTYEKFRNKVNKKNRENKNHYNESIEISKDNQNRCGKSIRKNNTKA